MRKLSSCIIVFNQKDHVLLQHKIKYDAWEFVGGKQDPNETSYNTAVRECLEESGLLVPDLVYLGLYEGHPRYSCSVFTGRYYGTDEPKTMEPEKHDKIEWVSRSPALQKKFVRCTKQIFDAGLVEIALTKLIDHECGLLFTS